MSRKWMGFQSGTSPLKIEINMGNANIVADWQRLDWSNTYVNGKSLEKLMEKEGLRRDQLDEQTVPHFFDKIILKSVPSHLKEEAREYLMRSFHQGGLLHPVSSAMYHLFSKDKLGPRSNDSTKRINIVTHSNGFSLQEIYTVNEFSLTPDSSEALQNQYPDNIITPDPDQAFCIKAQATLEVSFSGDRGPSINTLSSHISYGNTHLQSLADTRQWYSKFVDFIKSLLELNTVEDLSQASRTAH